MDHRTKRGLPVPKTYNLNIAGIAEYVRVFAGIYRLTPAQQKVLAGFVTRIMELERTARPAAEAFSAESRALVATRCAMTSDLVSHYLKMLVRKKAVLRSGHVYSVQSILIPPPASDPQVHIVFSYGRKG